VTARSASPDEAFARSGTRSRNHSSPESDRSSRVRAGWFAPDRVTQGEAPRTLPALPRQRGPCAPVIMAARSSGWTNDGGGGGPQANNPLAPSRSWGVHSWSSTMQSRSE
jgi:hypothetical protein